MRSAVLAAAAASLLSQTVSAFIPVQSRRSIHRSPRPLFCNAALEEAAALKAQAEKIRLEAERLDAQLTLEKVNSLEKKLNNKSWREGHPEEEVVLREKLQDLNNRLQGKAPIPKTVRKTSISESTAAKTTETTTKESIITEKVKPKEPSKAPLQNQKPVAGFDPAELELFLPVARRIEERLSSATMDEKLEAFRSEPELQDHFSAKIHELLVKPMQNIQKLESYKSRYLSSTSSVEKEQLKRQIDALDASMEKSGPLKYSRGIYREIPEMTAEELQERVDAIEALPELMQCLYKKRNEVDQGADLSLAILVEHYEPQLQLLDQIRFMAPLTEDGRKEAIQGYESLPKAVQEHFCKNIGLEPCSDAATVVKELEGDASEMKLGFGKIVVEASKAADLPEYSDIEFLDRSMYVESAVLLVLWMPTVLTLQRDVHLGMLSNFSPPLLEWKRLDQQKKRLRHFVRMSWIRERLRSQASQRGSWAATIFAASVDSRGEGRTTSWWRN